MANINPDQSSANPKVANDYRVVFANAFGMRLSDNDATIYFLMNEDPANMADSERQMAVAMTPRSVKTLATMLLETIVQAETAAGVDFVLSGEKQTQIYKAFKAAYLKEHEQ